MEDFLRVTVNDIFIGNTEDFHGNGILGDDFRNHSTKTTKLGMLLDGDNTASLGGRLTNGLFVAGFQPVACQPPKRDKQSRPQQ